MGIRKGIRSAKKKLCEKGYACGFTCIEQADQCGNKIPKRPSKLQGKDTDDPNEPPMKVPGWPGEKDDYGIQDDATMNKVNELLDRGIDTKQVARITSTQPDVIDKIATDRTKRDEDMRSINELAQKGLPPDEIAAAVGVPQPIVDQLLAPPQRGLGGELPGSGDLIGGIGQKLEYLGGLMEYAADTAIDAADQAIDQVQQLEQIG